MAPKGKTGLIIGKFAPLHKGHQFLIESALEAVGHLIVLVYDVPGLTAVPVEVRMGWIKRLYPEVEVLSAGIGPTETGDTPEVNQLHIDHAKSMLPPGAKIDAVFSSEDYAQYLAAALGAENVVIDKARSSVPVSGGMVRGYIGHYCKYLENFVYEDLIKYDKDILI
jgi:cytidyltransferase-like protein